jgi:hypothetical protein
MDKKEPQIVLSIFNVLGFAGVVVVNALANILPLNNKTTGQLSDQYPNLFVPAGLTFSIWGLIYLLLAAFVVYGMVRALKPDGKTSFISKIGVFFVLTCMANIGWIFAWHYEILTLSFLLMLALLGCLIAIYLRLSIGKSDASNWEKYLVHLPFSLYLGWISIATIANITALLVAANWTTFGLGEQFWAVAVITVGIAIALAAVFLRRDIYFGLVVDWALLGILIKRLAAEPTPDFNVVITAAAGLVMITGCVLFQAIRQRVY